MVNEIDQINIRIRTLGKKDIVQAKRFMDFTNALVREKAQIIENKEQSLEKTKEYLRDRLKETEDKRAVFLLVEDNKKIVGRVEIYLAEGWMKYVGRLRIAISQEYRGIGLGTHLIKEIIKLAKKQLSPKPNVIRISAFSINKAGIGLYKKIGFKQIAKISKQYYWEGKFIDEIIMLLKV